MHCKSAAKWLIKKDEALRYKTYCSDDDAENGKKNPKYKGEGCIHMIIANRDFNMALFLLESSHKNDSDEKKNIRDCEDGTVVYNGYPINEQRATGEFFKG